MEKEGLFTTVVGSWPLENTPENMIKAFEAQIKAGIDYVCYPQLVNMNSQFLTPLSQIIEPLEQDNDFYYLSSDFKVPAKPFALEYGEFIVNYLKSHPNVKELIKGTKACLTGPFTLASEIILKDNLAKGIDPQFFNEPRAIRLDYIIDKLAEIMKKIGQAYNEMGIDIISMDEPMLGLLVGRKSFFYPEDFYIETLNKALSGITGLPSIHVCGRISPALRDLLLQTDVKIMDHEFRTNDKNFNVFQREHFENTNKYLAMGTVETKFSPMKDATVEEYVEKLDFLEAYIKKGIELYGRQNLVIKPDCGFGPLKVFKSFGYEIALRKIENMVLALKKFK